MRIAHVISTPAGIGGAERVLIALERDARTRGEEVVVFNPFSVAADDSALAQQLQDGTYESFAARRLVDVPRLRAWLKSRLNHFEPDIVHAHLFHAQTVVGSLGSQGHSKRLVTHHHGAAPALRNRWSTRFIEKRMVQRFDHVVAVSRSVEEFLTRQLNVPAEKVTHIPNGWNGQPLPRSGNHPPTIISTANLRPEKGHSVLLEAFTTVRRSVADVRLVLLGDGPLTGEIERRARDLHVADAVEFVGPVDNVWPHLARADIFVLASNYESLGIAVLEAMAAGLPVVASAVGGIPELIEPGRSGILVPPENPQVLAQEILGLLASPEQREALGSTARTAVLDLSEDTMLSRYRNLYEGLTSKPGGRQ